MVSYFNFSPLHLLVRCWYHILFFFYNLRVLKNKLLSNFFYFFKICSDSVGCGPFSFSSNSNRRSHISDSSVTHRVIESDSTDIDDDPYPDDEKDLKQRERRNLFNINVLQNNRDEEVHIDNNTRKLDNDHYSQG